jgi:hypothetical protein
VAALVLAVCFCGCTAAPGSSSGAPVGSGAPIGTSGQTGTQGTFDFSEVTLYEYRVTTTMGEGTVSTIRQETFDDVLNGIPVIHKKMTNQFSLGSREHTQYIDLYYDTDSKKLIKGVSTSDTGGTTEFTGDVADYLKTTGFSDRPEEIVGTSAYTSIGTETVTVPYGTLTGCTKYQYTSPSSAGTVSLWKHSSILIPVKTEIAIVSKDGKTMTSTTELVAYQTGPLAAGTGVTAAAATTAVTHTTTRTASPTVTAGETAPAAPTSTGTETETEITTTSVAVFPTGGPQATEEEKIAYVREFEGVYDSDWGEMTITADGLWVNGAYAWENGQFHAELAADGLTMEGTWGEEPTYTWGNDAGTIRFAFVEDHNRIEGTFVYGDGPGGGSFWATRK